MKLAVGYQLAKPGTRALTDIVREYASGIAEVSFAWPGEPSGRMPLGLASGLSLPEVQRQLEADLDVFIGLGVRLNLLLNASCYGEWAVSEALADRVGHLVDYLRRRFGLAVVTTCSPMIASLVKENFPGVASRASVNMRIGTTRGAACVGAFFDEYVLQREYNRNLAHLGRFKAWSDTNGKKIELLANSGCMAFCPGQTFHDNLVAHEMQASQIRHADFDPSLCRHVYLDPDNWAGILQSTWIRPEDIHHYEPYCDQIKLATRMHQDPERVIRAYVERSFSGNLLDLLEPGLGPMLGGRGLDNAAFPGDWFSVTSACGGECQRCAYCTGVLKQVLQAAR